MIRRSFGYFDKVMFKQLFVTIVRPHLEYGAPVWNPSMKRLINLLENVQRRATKMIPQINKLPYEQRLRYLDLPTLQYRRYRGDMIEAYKLSHEYYDTSVSQKVLTFQKRDASGYNLRGHDLQIAKNHHKGDIRKNSFQCRVARQWNVLPDWIVNAPSLNTFKNQLDKFWKNENVMYSPNINVQIRTSSMASRFVTMND